MNVKKYRAATMRDALEQVKSELGEEALVLGSKNLRRRGFLGFGAREMVEVRVSTEFTNSNAPEKKNGSTNRKSTFTSLSLNPAQSPTVPAREQRSNSAFSALAARAYATELKPNTLSVPATTKPAATVNETVKKQVVEEIVTAPSIPTNENVSTEKAETVASAIKRDPLVAELAGCVLRSAK